LDWGEIIHPAPPIFADGVIVCVTRHFECVAIDPLDGSNRWLFEIPLDFRARTRTEYRQLIDKLKVRRTAPDRWLASEAVVCGCRLLLTYEPVDRLYAIDVRSGDTNRCSPIPTKPPRSIGSSPRNCGRQTWSGLSDWALA
jgi:hypothetical protein